MTIDKKDIFYSMEPAEGHFERFEARLEDRRRKVFSWRIMTAVSIAAAFAILLIIGRKDHFVGIVANPDAVYVSYLEQVQDRYKDIYKYAGDLDSSLDAELDDLTEENIPLIDQLPEELSDRAKTKLLKTHYGRILDAVDMIKQDIKTQNRL